MVQRVYEFDVHLIINGELCKNLQKIRFIATYYEIAEQKLIEHFKIFPNVQLAAHYFIQDYNVWR